MNFDGYKDFAIKNKAEIETNSLTQIYLFDQKTKTFVYSENLSALSIEKIDLKNRTLETYSASRIYEVRKVHHFDRNGRITFTEEFSVNN